MKILYDYQAFEMQKFGGISRYFFEIFQRLNNDSTVNWSLPIRYSDNEYLKSIPQYKRVIGPKPDFYKEFLGGRKFKGKSRLYNLKTKFFPPPDLTDFNKKLTIEALKKSDFDIFHPSYYDEYFLDYIGNKPYVITVYDMIHEIFPEYFLYDSALINKRKVLKKAAMIMAISQSTKNDLMNFFGIPDEKIKVVYLSDSLSVSEDNTMAIEGLPERYILYVGNRRIYKNFYFFLDAILPILHQDPNLHIVCTGLEFDEYEIGYFNNLSIKDRLYHYFVNDASLSFLYKRAEVFVFPSLYEGFGLPVLEAFGCGCPVAISNVSSLPEVAGNAAVYFDPKNAASIRDALVKILYNKKLREELILIGKERLRMFSWNKMYDETIEVYKKVLSDKV